MKISAASQRPSEDSPQQFTGSDEIAGHVCAAIRPSAAMTEPWPHRRIAEVFPPEVLDDAEHGHDRLAQPRRRRDPRGRAEYEPGHGFGPEHGRAEPDEPAERVADPRRRQRILRLEHAQHRLGERIERGTAPRGSEPPWPGSSGTITRRSAASSGAISRQFEARPPSPWTRTTGGPSPPAK